MSLKPAAQQRLVFTVAPYLDGWAVEHEGVYSDASKGKEEAKAAANKRARAAQDAGQACQVRVIGESGYFADVRAVARGPAVKTDADG